MSSILELAFPLKLSSPKKILFAFLSVSFCLELFLFSSLFSRLFYKTLFTFLLRMSYLLFQAVSLRLELKLPRFLSLSWSGRIFERWNQIRVAIFLQSLIWFIYSDVIGLIFSNIIALACQFLFSTNLVIKNILLRCSNRCISSKFRWVDLLLITIGGCLDQARWTIKILNINFNKGLI